MSFRRNQQNGLNFLKKKKKKKWSKGVFQHGPSDLVIILTVEIQMTTSFTKVRPPHHQFITIVECICV